MHIACVGAGPAGLYLAILLKRQAQAHEVTVFERSPRGRTAGWGIVYWDDLLEQLAGADPPSAARIRDASWRWAGQALWREGRETRRLSAGGYGLGRSRLIEILTERAEQLGVRLRFETEIGDARQCLGADLIVASDGSGSALRRADAGAFGPDIAAGRNKYIWLGVRRRFDAFTFGFCRTDAGHVWFHAYTYGELSTFIAECRPETWAGLGFDRMTPEDSARTLSGLFAPELGGASLMTGGSTWQNFRTVRNRTWVAGRTVLLGDAAHTAHFSIGSGAKLALEDAMALAAALGRERGVEAALEAYERERRPLVALVQADASASAAWFETLDPFADMGDQQFFAVLLERRSRLLAALPPRTAAWVAQASQHSAGLQRARRAGSALLKRLGRGRDSVPRPANAQPMLTSSLPSDSSTFW